MMTARDLVLASLVFPQPTDREQATLQARQQRARMAGAAMRVALADGLIAGAPAHPIGRRYPTEVSRGDEAPDLTRSALGPTAYLVDLIKFIQSSLPTAFPNLDAFERRFYHPFKTLKINAAAVEQPRYQIEFASEAIERFTLAKRAGLARGQLYAEFANAGAGYPFPDILARIVNAYLSELAIRAREIADALAVAEGRPDRTKLDGTLNRFKLSEAELFARLTVPKEAFLRGLTAQETQTVLNRLAELGVPQTLLNTTLTQLTQAVREAYTPRPPDATALNAILARLHLPTGSLDSFRLPAPTIEQVEALPDILRENKTQGQYPNEPANPEQAAVYKEGLDRAESIIRRIKEATLADVRANLIYAALKADPSQQDAKTLGNYLHVDLAADISIVTTCIASLIETLQSFIQAFQLGRENVQTTANTDFEARWRWLQNYAVWHAAMMVLLYPENFLMPRVRRTITAQFEGLLQSIESTTPSLLQDAIEEYVRGFPGEPVSPGIMGVCRLDDRLVVVSYDSEGKYAVIAMSPSGEWTGRQPLELDTLSGVLGLIPWNNRVYVMRRVLGPSGEADKLRYKCLSFVDGTMRTTVDTTVQSPTLPVLPMMVPTRDALWIYHTYKLGNDTILRAYLLRANGAIDNTYWLSKTAIANADALPCRIAAGAIGEKHYLALGGQSSDRSSYLCEVDLGNGTVQQYALPAFTLPSGADLNQNISAAVDDRYVYILRSAGRNYPAGRPVFTQNRLYVYEPGGRLVTDVSLGSLAGLEANGPRLVTHSGALYVFGNMHVVTLQPATGGNWTVGRPLAFTRRLPRALTARPRSADRGPDYLERYRREQDEAFGGCTIDDPAYIYLEEYYHFIPLAIAHVLNGNRLFREADEWLRMVYDPFAAGTGGAGAVVYRNLEGGSAAEVNTVHDKVQWLRDPFNPYWIAHLRQGVFKRHAIYQYVENLLDWADAEFTRDTPESIAHARELYELAEDVLQAAAPPQHAATPRTRAPDATLQDLSNGLDRRWEQEALAIDTSTLAPAFGSIDAIIAEFERNGEDLLRLPEVFIADMLLFTIGSDGFSIPANPLLETLTMRIEANLEKIRTGRNMLGVRRRAALYAASSDPMALIQQLAAGESFEENIQNELPLFYRFSYLIERARYYTQVAQQLEALLLEAYKEYDAESYSLLKARQDLNVSQANVTLQGLRMREAADGYALAQAQTQRAAFQRDRFQELITQGELPYEQEAIHQLWVAHDWSLAGSAIGAAAQGVASGAMTKGWIGAIVGGVVGLLQGGVQGNVTAQSLRSQARAIEASYQRRAQEWTFQRDLAGKDIMIAQQGETLALDRQTITQQEHVIAQLQHSYAAEVLTFLGTKFTNRELWEWMGRVVRRYYRAHLDFATTTARMAQQALAFERQEPIAIIAPHYAQVEKRDLLAAEQLLTDINKLDQHRLTTEKRRKELTKVISLASVAPVEFQQLRRQGWMSFATLLSWFDRDFPGHYLRLIKSVSLSVVGLIAPGEAVHATLSNNGFSEVIVGPPYNEPKIIQRPPESIAVSAAGNGTGLFELRLDDPVLLPFEGSGVQAIWTLEMPKGANRFDYATLVDVLFTIRYTALDDPDYRRKLLKRLGADDQGRLPSQGMTSLSLRTSFPDSWYHLHNPVFLADPAQYGFGPGQTPPPYVAEFEITADDFPPNEEVQKISRLTLALSQERFVKAPLEIEFQPDAKAPDGKQYVYRTQADYTWDPSNTASGPLALTSFAQRREASAAPTAAWESVATPVVQMKPFGTWRLRIRTDVAAGAYAELFRGATTLNNQIKLDLSWLKDTLVVVTYDAMLEYRYAQ